MRLRNQSVYSLQQCTTSSAIWTTILYIKSTPCLLQIYMQAARAIVWEKQLHDTKARKSIIICNLYADMHSNQKDCLKASNNWAHVRENEELLW